MEWNKLLSSKRHYVQSAGSAGDPRTEFQKDYHRIIESASFRRLQDKTQVFPLDKSDFVRTRLTHSLEVSSFAKSLGQSCFSYIIDNNLDSNVDNNIRDNVCNILECAGLIHDIGNPPFGHFGEKVICEWFRKNIETIKFNGVSINNILTEQMKNDLLNFEGNAQALRLLTKLHYLVDENGMHLTYALLNTIIKYPIPSTSINPKSGNVKNKKLGYYFAEQDVFAEITSETGSGNFRHPLTYLLEASDDIAYKTADIEDAVKKGCLTYDMLYKELQDEKYYKMYKNQSDLNEYKDIIKDLQNKHNYAVTKGILNPELNAVQNWLIHVQGKLLSGAKFAFTRNYREIMNGNFQQELLSSSKSAPLVKALGDIACKYAFCSTPILKLEIAAETILNSLLDKFVNAAVNYGENDKMSALDKKLMSIVSDNYKQSYHRHSYGKNYEEKLYLKILLVTDFICGMTDSYAKDLYQELNGIK